MASRDFLGDFGRKAAPDDDKAGSAAGGESDEIELSLGLSLGGCFGTDPAGEAKRPCLARSSSISSVYSLRGNGGEELATAEPPPPLLHRTSSLPAEYDIDRIQRRAMQSERRQAAKRKRLERRNSMNSSRSSAGPSGASRDEGQEPAGGVQPRRSAATQGSSSANLVEQGGASGGAEMRSPAAMNTSSDSGSGPNSSLPPAPSTGTRPRNGATGEQAPAPAPLRTLRSLTMRTASTGDFRKTMAEEMPMVFSRLEGPNARRISGFLYQFGKANDLRIVCVCHGRFLTPVDFIRHAGGGAEDLAHPLRHIIINRQPSEFL